MNESLFSKIEGYLQALAHLNSDIDSVGYYFLLMKEEKVADVTTQIKELVVNQYKSTTSILSENNQDLAFLRYLNTHIELIVVHNWERSVREACKKWFFKAFLRLEKLKKNSTTIQSSAIRDDFANMLKEFFGDELIGVWKFDEKIKGDLSGFWGGLEYEDFIFETKDFIYILSFQIDD